MNELVKALKNFIVRDIIYIIGGASVILSFLYLFDRMCIIGKETSTVTYLFIAGISYVIGYCIQDTASLIGIVTTADIKKPRPALKWLYQHFMRSEDWKDIALTAEELDKANIVIQERACQDIKSDHERIISLMMVGTTIGPCGLLSGILLLIKTFINKNCTFTFNILLAISVLVISALLIIFGRIKALQMTKSKENLYNFYRRFREYDP